MREFSFQYKFEKGLRAFPDEPRNSGALEECHNLKVYGGHLVVPEAPTSIFGPGYADPQIFCLQEGNYLGSDIKLVTLDTSLDITTILGTTAPLMPWSVADFGPYVAFTNGTTIYTSNPTTGVVSAYGGTDIPVCKCLTNYKGQMISGSPTGYDSNVVLWGDIGRANMDLNDSVTVGYMPMPFQGSIWQVRRLGEYVAIYGSDGIALLQTIDSIPVGFGLKEVLAHLGLITASACAGSILNQVFIRSDGMLCSIQADMLKPHSFKYSELGYQSWFKDLTNIKVSFDESLNEFYISSDTTNFIYTSGGLSTTHMRMDTCQFYNGNLYGVYTSVGSTAHYIKLSEMDLGARVDKAIESIEVACDGTWSALVDWRRTTSASFASSPAFSLNPMGAGKVKVSGSDFKIKLLSVSSTAQLDMMTVRWKYQGKQFIRGLDANQTPSRSDK